MGGLMTAYQIQLKEDLVNRKAVQSKTKQTQVVKKEA